MMPSNKHIFTPDDHAIVKRVLVNGEEIKKAFYCDTRKGFVDAYIYPFRIDRYGKRCLWKRHRGAVTVELEDGL